MKKRLFCLFLALALVIALVPAQALATDSPTIRCGSTTAAPQNGISINVEADSLQNLAALELTVFYDPQALEFQYANTGSLIHQEITSIHHAEGSVTLTVASVGGISGSGILMNLHFTVRDNCAPGRYPLVVAVGEAYDTGRIPVSIAARSGSVTVTESAPTISQFLLGMSLSHSTLSPGETVTVSIQNSWGYNYASFDLTVHYDAAMFRLVSASVPEHFAQQGALCSLNTATDGLVRLTCASTGSISNYEMLELQLEVKEGAMGTTALTAEISDVYDADRFPYQPGSAEGSLTVIPSQSVRLPQLRLEGDTPVIGEETLSTLILDAGSGLAAADFQLTYDPGLLECISVESAADSQYLLINPNFSDGTIRFSFVEEAGVIGEISLVNIRWKARSGADRHYSVQATLIDPVDADFRPVVIDCPLMSGCIYARHVTEPTCDTPGGEQLVCVSCGKAAPVDPIPPLGHSYGEPVFQWTADYTACSATRVCARDGSHVWQVECVITEEHVGRSCTEPGSVTYTATADFYGEVFTDRRTVQKDVLGHDYEWTVITEPGCTTEGLRRGSCSRCGASAEEAMKPLGHDYQSTITEPGCTEAGFTVHTCTRCGDSYTDTYTDPTGHNYEWFPMELPTCTEDGLDQGKCTGCGDLQTRVVPALGHDWDGILCRLCGELRDNPFTDVPENSFYFDPVLWAVKNGITNGATATTFNPGGECLRAHVVTFLWRAAGCPEPSSTANPFTDVKESDFFYKPVLWAVEKGITNGISATEFGSFAACNRAQVVTFLYRAMGNPAYGAVSSPFTDVTDPKAFYYNAVLWAVENGITNGMGNNQFGIGSICNRAQVVTFLYRTFQ